MWLGLQFPNDMTKKIAPKNQVDDQVKHGFFAFDVFISFLK